ncbi:MAG: FAD-binding protein [Candidatus Latescibacteria bacterium]|nr:FAD-binding protein [bacterium]MBD3425468.1 FAD-binding protein [Candidatus Latescibacterota bacterium]
MVKFPSSVLSRLKRSLRGIEVISDPAFLTAYRFDATGRRGRCRAVIFPVNREEFSRAAAGCMAMDMPVVTRGAGTGFSGGSVPVEDSVIISTERMNRVLSFNRLNEQVQVEAGLVNGKLQQFLEGEGFFYPPDPASFRVSTIGGNIAENAGGPRAYRYGVTRRYVRELEWVMPDGEFCRSGPEGIGALITGSEGTLGMIYSAVLSVLPVPESRLTFLLEGGTDREAMDLASELLGLGFRPSVFEFIDSKTIQCVAEYLGLEELISGRASLFFEVEGTGIETLEQKGIIDGFCDLKGMKLVSAEKENRREHLWELRRSISPSLARRGITKINEDIALPLGRLSEAVGLIHRMAAERWLDCYIFGHCGDGNLHVNVMTDRRKKEEMARTADFVDALFRYVAGAGGTLSGEHGIGVTKRDYLDLVFSEEELELQEGIKKAMDGESRLNPGKYFDGITGGGSK